MLGYTDWISTDPNGFNKELTDSNTRNLSYLKPTIRLIKYWNAQNDYIYESFELEKYLVNQGTWLAYNQKGYFYEGIEVLETPWDMSYSKTDKVNRAKNIVNKVKEYEQGDMPYHAESEIKKLIPTIY